MAKYRSAYTGQQIDTAIDTVYNLADVATSGDYNDLINTPDNFLTPNNVDSTPEMYKYKEIGYIDTNVLYTPPGVRLWSSGASDFSTYFLVFVKGSPSSPDTDQTPVTSVRQWSTNSLIWSGSKVISYAGLYLARINDGTLELYRLAVGDHPYVNRGSVSINTSTNVATFSGINFKSIELGNDSTITYRNRVTSYYDASTGDVYYLTDNSVSSSSVTLTFTCVSEDNGAPVIKKIVTNAIASGSSSSSFTGAYSSVTLMKSGDIPSGILTDSQINGTSISSNGVANFLTETAYNSSTNKIATMSDIGYTTIRRWS